MPSELVGTVVAAAPRPPLIRDGNRLEEIGRLRHRARGPGAAPPKHEREVAGDV